MTGIKEPLERLYWSFNETRFSLQAIVFIEYKTKVKYNIHRTSQLNQFKWPMITNQRNVVNFWLSNVVNLPFSSSVYLRP